ncbi:MAG: GNAT family N-acetyltransferase [Frateuria sp.]|uniref:GNAT family N-acetyltransferase n=1 Tax=Frateuria sp. TaxID=2211372 RepID=UPI0017BC0553|nr:GNAT family N-acetyltransferase [Frateuria sp.]NUO71894.1 GNAT family N-acetyltransferase [Frateuria sp.]NUR23603.1 GNAT family N-acetyltransferase [Frateuria sp.]
MGELKTARLRIQPLTLDDDAFVLRLLNEPSFVQHIADKGVRDLEGARAFLRDGPLASYAQHGFGMWRVALADTGTAIGMAGLLKRDYLDGIDVGYAFLPEYTGQGYALEATRAIMEHVRSLPGVRRVLAIVNPDNARSIGLLGKLGFEPDGTVRIPDSGKLVRLFAAALP